MELVQQETDLFDPLYKQLSEAPKQSGNNLHVLWQPAAWRLKLFPTILCLEHKESGVSKLQGEVSIQAGAVCDFQVLISLSIIRTIAF